MRERYIIIFIVLAVVLLLSAFAALRSRKSIGLSVSWLLTSLVPPVIGNMLIIMAEEERVARIGCYMYFVGMSIVVLALMNFTWRYCYGKWPNTFVRFFVLFIVVADCVQILCNLRFGHCFSMEQIMVDGSPYFRFVPHIGQTVHRLVDYGILAVVLLIFLIKIFRTPRIYRERYSVIFLSLILFSIWQTFYIISRRPVDRSMVGFGVFGLLVFYFAIIYRPMRLLDSMLANIASEMPEAILFFDASGRGIWANRPGIELLRLQDGDFDKIPDKVRSMFGTYDEREEWTTKRVLGANANLKYYVLEKHTVKDNQGHINGSFMSIRDNTSEQMQFRRRLFEANHDSLTGLNSRERLYEHIRDRLEAEKLTRFMLMFVDIADFKIVNDIFGTAFGDYVLKCLAEWIRTGISEHAVCGRLAGDTFGVFLPVEEFNELEIERSLKHFVVSDGTISHAVLVHVGTYEITEPGLDISVMFDRAHMALMTIKDEYQVHIAYYDDKMREQVLWNQHISAQMHEAIEKQQIVPYLQPIVDKSGRVAGAEVLVRWMHPEDGFLAPGRFIPVFEQNGMIAEIDLHMWRCACEILARWQREGRDMFLSVNISPKDFYFMDVAATIRSVTKEFGVEPRRLRLEITETVMMSDVARRMETLASLRADGFIIEMDDFGSGYSSLNMLKDMPVDVLKVDMVFLKNAGNSEKSNKILRSVLHLSRDLDILSLTEGVETDEQFRMLSDMGCSLFQGFYFAKPMPEEDFEIYSRRGAAEAI